MCDYTPRASKRMMEEAARRRERIAAECESRRENFEQEFARQQDVLQKAIQARVALLTDTQRERLTANADHIPGPKSEVIARGASYETWSFTAFIQGVFVGAIVAWVMIGMMTR